LLGLSAVLCVQAVQQASWVFIRETTLWGVVATVLFAQVFAALAYIAFMAQPMVPSSESEALLDSPAAHFSRTSEGWLLCEPAASELAGKRSDALFLLYCGVKLDPTHYAGQACELAKLGISTVILQSPLNMVFFPPAPAQKVIEAMSGRFTRFVLGGHSLGAFYCCRFLQDSAVQHKVAGVALIGNWVRESKPFDLSGLRKGEKDMPVALINGDLDIFVLKFVESTHGGDMRKFETACKRLLPKTAVLAWIPGGNHFGVCDVTFGRREGYPFRDNKLRLARSEQQRQTAEVIARLCRAGL
jgi:hypothetical protein